VLAAGDEESPVASCVSDPAPAAATPAAGRKGSTCRKGHALQTAAAMAGSCDGCEKPVLKGELVMDCRQCNFYMCKNCVSISHCPKSHPLQKWVCQSGGVCDGCSEVVEKGQMVMDCRKCDWFLCRKCCPQEAGEFALASLGGKDAVCTPCTPLPECPSKHKLGPRLAVAGTCDKCGKAVRNGEGVMSCNKCNWYLCSTCHPISQCPEGHSLRAVGAIVGKCDLCSKPMKTNQNVLDCRRCNWYICAMCFQPRACDSEMRSQALGGA
jgi:hypothetical protein